MSLRSKIARGVAGRARSADAAQHRALLDAQLRDHPAARQSASQAAISFVAAHGRRR